MRRRRAAKQCIWLGAIGHFCGCQRRLTKPDSNSNRDCHGNSYRNTYTNGNTHSNCSRNSHAHTESDCEPEAASHTCAEAIRRDFQAIG